MHWYKVPKTMIGIVFRTQYLYSWVLGSSRIVTSLRVPPPTAKHPRKGRGDGAWDHRRSLRPADAAVGRPA